MAHSFMQSVDAAVHLLNDSAGLTVWHPATVNTLHPALG